MREGNAKLLGPTHGLHTESLLQLHMSCEKLEVIQRESENKAFERKSVYY